MKKTHRWLCVTGSWECSKVDWGDYEWASQHRWYKNATGYVEGARAKSPQQRRLHRMICGCVPNDKTVVDHINHNPFDNRRQNLRVVSIKVNIENRGKLNRNNSSGYRGVHLDKHQKWVAQIMHYRKNINLGRYTNLQDAVRARAEAEKKYFTGAIK